MRKGLAWHFLAEGNKLRDGTTAPKDGVWLEHKGELSLCKSGLHFSRQPFDALRYAPGPILCLVEIGGEIVEPEAEDKGVCSRRKIIARMDATELLRYYARMQALSVIHLNEDLSEVVCDYLMTGDESLRSAAESAAWSAAASAARSAAWSEAESAARSAAWSAAARSAAESAARSAAWSAAARSAAESAAWSAASAESAARSAAWSAERSAERQHFNDLVSESFEGFL